MQIILVNPQIPHNTGAIVRLCAVTGSSLILVPPLGFSLADRHLKRAGLDYWEGVNVQVLENIDAYLENTDAPFYIFSSKGKTRYSDIQYTQKSILIFGSETSGVPASWHDKWQDRMVTIPMMPGQRCLNLANSASIAVYEAWRQQNFSC